MFSVTVDDPGDSVCTPATIDDDWRMKVLKNCVCDPELAPILELLQRDVSTLSLEERARARHFALLDDGLYFLEGRSGPRLVIPKVRGDNTKTVLYVVPSS